MPRRKILIIIEEKMMIQSRSLEAFIYKDLQYKKSKRAKLTLTVRTEEDK